MNPNQISEVQSRIDSLLDKSTLTPHEEKELDRLGDILISLEEDIDIPDMYGLEMLHFLMKDRGVSASSIENVLGKPIPSTLNDKEIKVLSLYFNVSEYLFIPKDTPSKL